ncbi:MAG: L,D-transpeptidase family protein [Chitinophagaceae bacterium]|nr:L,D-transpeptidase family protein [Chitinophagaceae bacterium]
MRLICALICLLSLQIIVQAQPPLETKYPDLAFQNYQMSFERVRLAYAKHEPAVKRMFESKDIKYPCKNILYRGFKATNDLELWARNSIQDTFTLIKTYKICALSGILGPKRVEGDKQVPEGFYFIAEFNPKSEYYLSMLVNYPNYSDLIAGDKSRPGGDIYIHGACMTVGCMPMTNEWIEELYIISMISRIHGELNIPVHIFPLRYTQKGLDYIGREYKNEAEKQKFWVNLKRAYDYFEATHKSLPVMYDEKGDYAF